LVGEQIQQVDMSSSINQDPIEPKFIRIRGAREHNLKDIDIDIPRERLVVVTGLSGSGKSSLAFDTIYAEGQRKYVESLSAYARQFLEQIAKPHVDHIEGLPPTLAIEQRSGLANPRSTVATTTEIYDYLRLLFARVGVPFCHRCGRRISQQTVEQMVDTILSWPAETRFMVLGPLVRGKKGEHKDILQRVKREGFVRVRIDRAMYDINNPPDLGKKARHTIEAVVDRLTVKPSIRTRLADSLETALRLSDGLVVVPHETADGAAWTDDVFSEKYACPDCGISLAELEPRIFSFNSPYGACPACGGLGIILEFDPELLVPDPSLSLANGAIDAWRRGGKRMNIFYNKLLREFCDRFAVSADTPFKDLPADIRRILLAGSSDEDAAKYHTRFEGVIPNLQRRWARTDSEYVKARLHAYLSEQPCRKCKGARLTPEALSVRIASRNIHEVVQMTIDESMRYLDDLDLSGEAAEIAEQILKEIRQRLGFLVDVGLGYLTLDRPSATLSGGEAQRIRLATQVGSGLVGVCYVLDEPTIGLHPRDNEKLIRTLRRLADMGNSVLVVEHDEGAIRAADYVIDMGPGPGARGGQIVAHGTLEQVLRSPASITAKYLTGQCTIPLPSRRRGLDRKRCIELLGCREHNLKGIGAKFPLGGFMCVTGVSGSGKSTLVSQTLLNALRRRLYGSKDRPGAHDDLIGTEYVDKVIEIDQSPIGRTPRSNPATYTGVFDLIRQLYARTREAKIRGYSAGRFSFNVKGGRCEACQGQGVKRIEMHFLPDVFVSCERCKGRRYNRETLEIRYKGKSIADVLDMRIEEAYQFFSNFAKIKQLLRALTDVGLSYMQLGQPSTTLSGGEAQRVKLAAELGKTATGHTVYILDEPTTGLHFADIQNLLAVLNRLADMGNTVIVIEHNLDVIKTADWILDLGPEGGENGGRIVAEGTPEQIADNPSSYTGMFLRPKLQIAATG
jgi:excinuclease ABC subunit A